MPNPKTQAIMRPGRVEARQADLAQFIDDKGTWVEWEEAVLCPCHNQETGAWDPNHDLCASNYGILYFPAVRTQVLITNQDWAKNFMMGYPTTSGTAAFTFRGWRPDKATKELSIGETFYPAYGDRITMKDELICISDERKIKGRTSKTGRSLEVTRFRTVKELIRVVSLSSDRSAFVVHEPGVDVTVVPDANGDMRQIEWVSGGTAPAADAQYTLRYLTHPEFIIRDIEPKIRREKENVLPPFVRAYRIDQVRPA